MRMRHWTSVLRLMSLMVIADDRVREEELRVFAFRMMELRRRVAPDLMFSEGLVRDWFEAHHAEMAAMDAGARGAAVGEVLAALDDLDSRRELVEAINAVARADGHRHDAEMAIIHRAAERWGAKVPRR